MGNTKMKKLTKRQIEAIVRNVAGLGAVQVCAELNLKYDLKPGEYLVMTPCDQDTRITVDDTTAGILNAIMDEAIVYAAYVILDEWLDDQSDEYFGRDTFGNNTKHELSAYIWHLRCAKCMDVAFLIGILTGNRTTSFDVSFSPCADSIQIDNDQDDSKDEWTRYLRLANVPVRRMNVAKLLYQFCTYAVAISKDNKAWVDRIQRALVDTDSDKIITLDEWCPLHGECSYADILYYPDELNKHFEGESDHKRFIDILCSAFGGDDEKTE